MLLLHHQCGLASPNIVLYGRNGLKSIFTLFLFYLDFKCIFTIQTIQHPVAGSLEVPKTISTKNEPANLFILRFHIAVINAYAINSSKRVNYFYAPILQHLVKLFIFFNTATLECLNGFVNGLRCVLKASSGIQPNIVFLQFVSYKQVTSQYYK